MKNWVLLIFVMSLIWCGAYAETLRCEIWTVKDIPAEFDSIEFTELRAKNLIAEGSAKKRSPAIGSAMKLLWEIGEKSGLENLDYRHCDRISVFRCGSDGVFRRVVDGIDAGRFPLYRLYESDLIIFHENELVIG